MLQMEFDMSAQGDHSELAGRSKQTTGVSSDGRKAVSN